MISGWLFALFVVFSLILVVSFYWGVKANIRKAKEVAAELEKALSPDDKKYTWLGGVIGFYAEYKVRGFSKITATLRLIPRHAVLWLPITFLIGRRDTLQMLFFLKMPVRGECHVVRKGKRVKIYNIERLKEEAEDNWRLLFDSREQLERLRPLLKPLEPLLIHCALTPDNRVLYLNLLVPAGGLEGALKEFKSRLVRCRGF